MGVEKHREGLQSQEKARGEHLEHEGVNSARLTWSRRSKTSPGWIWPDFWGSEGQCTHVCGCVRVHAHLHTWWPTGLLLPGLMGHLCLLTLTAPCSRLGVDLPLDVLKIGFPELGREGR